MPRAFYCDGCQQTHLIRDELVGRKIRCDCGRVQVASENAAQVPIPTKWLDSWPVLGSSCALLLVSLLVGGGIAAWVVLDQGTVENTPTPTAVAAAPERAPIVAPPREKERPASKSKGKEHEKAEDNDKEKEKEKARPQEPAVARAPDNPGSRRFTEEELHKRLLRSVVWIYGENESSAWTGSGAVIHVGRRLIVTNRHVVQSERRVQVLFPVPDPQGEVITDKQYYKDLLRKGKGKSALVLVADKDRDLAVIQLESPLPQNTVAVKMAPRPARPGERLVSVGNPGPSAALWVPSPGIVRSRVPQILMKVPIKNEQGEVVGQKEIVVRPARSLETTLPINHGDSGSPVVNDRGQLVAVNFGGDDKQQLMQWAVDRDEVLRVLEAVNVRPEEVVASEVLPATSAVVLDLIKLLDDMDLERCRKAVEDLSRVDPVEARRAVPALVRAQERHGDPGFRRRSTEELERIGPPVKEDIDCLGQAMRIPYKPLHMYVVHALTQLGPDAKAARARAFAPLLRMANDSDEELARAGLDALLELGPMTEAEIDVLTEALGDTKRRIWVRRFAAHRLGEQGLKASRAVPGLAKVLQTEQDYNLLSLSIGALRRIGDKRGAATAALIAVIASHPAEKLRLEALEALEAVDLSAFPTGQMLECSITDKSEAMRNALASKLGVRLGELKPEQMSEMIPLFRHKEPAIILAGLKIVLMKKRDAGPISAELAVLIKHSDAKVRKKAVEALQAVGPAAKQAVSPLLEILKEVPAAQRPTVAVTIGMIEPKDPKVVEAVLPTLLAGLHPRTEKDGGPKPDQVNKVVTAIGQPAVNAIFKLFETLPYRGTDNINHRKNLFLALASLGPGCKSKENLEQVKSLRDRERFERYADVLAAAQQAMKEMDPN